MNNYTFVSTRGCSVPDYLFCPIDNLKYCAEVKIMLMTDIVNLSGILPPLHLPDHSVIQSTFEISDFKIDKVKKSFPQNDRFVAQNSYSRTNPKKNLSKVNETFFMNDIVNREIQKTIHKIENLNQNQTELDQTWSDIKALFLEQLDTLPSLPSSTFKKTK